jgi:hypothetical protein
MALLRVPIRILIATTGAPFEAAQDERLIFAVHDRADRAGM